MREAVEKKVLSENDRLAAALRQRYRDEGILCVNLVSAPGSGKTMLLEKTLATFPNDTAVAVLTGGLQTDNNERRLARYGFPERQIVTGGTCHLDGRVVDRHLNEMGFRGPGPVDRECRQPGLSFELRPWESGQDCAAERDRGRRQATEISWNFPPFHADDFDEDRSFAAHGIQRELALENARRIHPEFDTSVLSARNGEGLDRWLAWLGALQQKVQHQRAAAIT